MVLSKPRFGRRLQQFRPTKISQRIWESVDQMVLRCTALNYTALHCTPMNVNVLYCIDMRHTKKHRFSASHIAMHCTAPHHNASQCTPLFCILWTYCGQTITVSARQHLKKTVFISTCCRGPGSILLEILLTILLKNQQYYQKYCYVILRSFG